jgi:hypothetical protein
LLELLSNIHHEIKNILPANHFYGSYFSYRLSNCGCNKTSKGFNAPTNPNDVEILMTKPDRAYEELGTIDAVKFRPSDTAKMYNAIRAKAAPLGANAVILTGVGIAQNGKQYAIGVAIAWK